MDLNNDGIFDLQDIVLIFTAITVIIGGTVLVIKQVLKPMSRWVQRQFREAVQESVAPSLRRIEQEVTANGGGSLKDLVQKNHNETMSTFKARDESFVSLAQPWVDRVIALETVVNGHVEEDRAAFARLDEGQQEILDRINELGSQDP